MTGFPQSPRVQSGAIVGADTAKPLASVIVFQYNPETLTRTLTAQRAGEGSATGDALRLTGPPREQIRLNIEIDATDQLAAGDPVTVANGIHPQLAALEMLLYPKSALVVANESLKLVGMLEIIPPTAPLTLFIWGAKRVLPVRLTGFSITEEAFDPSLNPIRATVDLTLDVLSYHNLGTVSIGGALSLGHHIAKEVIATRHSMGSIAATL